MEPYRGILNIFGFAALWLGLVVITMGIALIPFAIWAYVVWSGAEGRLLRAEERLHETLMPGENLLVTAVQLRPFALAKRRQSLGISDSRIILVSRGLLGGFTMLDIQWKDLQDAEVSEQVLPELCGSSLSFAFRKRDLGSSSRSRGGNARAASGLPTLLVGGVPCEEARRIYSTAQAQEQAWEEKRRVRAIEETRAAAGGVYLNTGASTGPDAAKHHGQSLVQELSSLKGLLDSGAITDVEFNEMKSKIIARA